MSEHNLRVCVTCLLGIESREGTQHPKVICLDEDSAPEERQCDWCGEERYILYELV